MSCRSRICIVSSAALPLFLLLSACGGGGGAEVASIPPPPPAPTPTPTPAVTLDVKVTPLEAQGTEAGTYDLLGRLTLTSATGTTSRRVLTAGETSLTIAKQNDILDFTLNASGILPAGLSSIVSPSPEVAWNATNDPMNPQILFGDDQNQTGTYHQYLGQRLTAYRVHSDGTEEKFEWYDFVRGHASSSQLLGTNERLLSDFTYNIGNSYVAMGEWSWRVVDLNGSSTGTTGELLFVNGVRTPPSGIPASGTATYSARTLSLLAPSWDSAEPGLPFTLTADFGQRTIATRIDQDYQHYPDLMGYGEPAIRNAAILGIHVGGSAPFSNDGSFLIPLAGTVNYSATNALVTPPSEPVTGSMNGAFFGPHAEEIGGTFSLDRAGGAPPIQDSFIGHQPPP